LVIYLYAEEAPRLEAGIVKVKVLAATVEWGAMMQVHGIVDGLL
jgi:hypothetical protein